MFAQLSISMQHSFRLSFDNTKSHTAEVRNVNNEKSFITKNSAAEF